MREQNGRFFFADSGSSRFCKAGYDPAEPRDKYSRWTREGSSTVAYEGHFHDLVVDDFLEGLKSQGSTVLKNIRILGLSGAIAIPDGASKPAGNNKPYFIEMKREWIPSSQLIKRRVTPLYAWEDTRHPSIPASLSLASPQVHRFHQCASSW